MNFKVCEDDICRNGRGKEHLTEVTVPEKSELTKNYAGLAELSDEDLMIFESVKSFESEKAADPTSTKEIVLIDFSDFDDNSGSENLIEYENFDFQNDNLNVFNDVKIFTLDECLYSGSSDMVKAHCDPVIGIMQGAHMNEESESENMLALAGIDFFVKDENEDIQTKECDGLGSGGMSQIELRYNVIEVDEDVYEHVNFIWGADGQVCEVVHFKDERVPVVGDFDVI